MSTIRLWCLFLGGVFDGCVLEVGQDDMDTRGHTWRCSPHYDGPPVRGHTGRCVYADTGVTRVVDGVSVRVFGHWADWHGYEDGSTWD